MTPICFIDTETDGVHNGRRPWEVAMIRRDTTGTRELAFFVDIDLATADPFGLQVGRFYERHPKGRYLAGDCPERSASSGGEYLTQRAAAYRVAQWTHGTHLVGAVPGFDAETLAPLLRAHGLTPAWHYHLIDVEAMAVGYLNAKARHAEDMALVTGEGPGVAGLLRGEAAALRAQTTPPYNSDELNAALGLPAVPKEERHTALGDARWAMRMYDAMTGRQR